MTIRSLKTHHGRYGVILHYANDGVIGAALDIYGEWAEAEVSIFKKLLNRGHRVLDLGANVGAHSLVLSRIVGEEGAVYAIEAQPSIHAFSRQMCA